MVRLLLALLVVALAVYALLLRPGDDSGRREALYESQMRQTREVEAQLQRQLEERMKALNQMMPGEEEETVPESPPWRH